MRTWTWNRTRGVAGGRGGRDAGAKGAGVNQGAAIDFMTEPHWIKRATIALPK